VDDVDGSAVEVESVDLGLKVLRELLAGLDEDEVRRALEYAVVVAAEIGVQQDQGRAMLIVSVAAGACVSVDDHGLRVAEPEFR
jgi:hypothetical protein